MSKVINLLKELLEEDKLDIKEIMEVLGYEISNHSTIDVFRLSETVEYEETLIGYDEVITIKKKHR